MYVGVGGTIVDREFESRVRGYPCRARIVQKTTTHRISILYTNVYVVQCVQKKGTGMTVLIYVHPHLLSNSLSTMRDDRSTRNLSLT